MKLIEELENGRPFWHCCEVCGKKEFLRAEDAFEAGWDYPPKMGKWGILSMRTCGECRMTDTIYWKFVTGAMTELTDRDRETIERIYNETFSLISGNDAKM